MRTTSTGIKSLFSLLIKQLSKGTIYISYTMMALSVIWWFCICYTDLEQSIPIWEKATNERLTITFFVFTGWICIAILADCIKDNFLFYNGYKSIIIQLFAVASCTIYILSLNSNILTCSVIVNIIYGLYFIQAERHPLPESEHPEKEDLLYRTRLFNRTQQQIRKLAKDTCQGLTIGICGQWGSGKTFFIDSLLAKLSKNNDTKSDSHDSYNEAFVICEKVELWATHSLTDAWNCVIHALHTAILKRPPLNSGFIKRIIHAILTFLNFNNNATSSIIDLVMTNVKKTEVNTIIKAMNGKKFVLVFDDLERADFKTIQAMLPLFERLKALPNLIVICAIAENELKQVFMQNKFNDDFAHGHLNKLFDLRIEIPQLAYSAIKNYQDNILSQKYSDCELTRSFFDKYPLRFDNIRQMIRIIEKLASIEREYYKGCSEIFKQAENGNSKVLTRVKFIFLVESLRIASPITLNQLSNKEDLLNFIKAIPNSLLPCGYEILKFEEDYDFSYSHLDIYTNDNNSEREKFKTWISNNHELYTEITNKKAVKSILAIISYDKDKNSIVQFNFLHAYNSNYTRCTTLHDWEKEYINETPNYYRLTYQVKIKTFFYELKEDIEHRSLPDTISSLFRYELQNLKKEGTYLNIMNETLENEYRSRSAPLSLYNLNSIDFRFFSHYIYNILNEKNLFIKIEYIYIKLFINIYKILSITEQARVIHMYSIGGYINDETTKKLCNDPNFKNLVNNLAQEYGYNMAYQISIYSKETESYNFKDDFSMQVYKIINDKTLISSIKNGIIQFISQLESKESFIHEWILFMGIQYRSASIRGGIESSFTSKEVFDMMQIIKNQLKDTLENPATIKDKQKIYEACEQTLEKLHKDNEQWIGKTSRVEHVSGLDNIISMIKNIRDSLT